jgi:hypothetical protein
MRRLLGIATVIMGAVFSVFVLNLLLYSLVPVYRGALLMTVSYLRRDIPVIEVQNDADLPDEEPVVINTNTKEIYDEETALSPVFEKNQDEEIKTETENFEKNEQKKPEIIERTYYEDCGTGHGYWVIKYSDGSYGIE